MQPKHVKEAFRLLNKSIIRVETPDVNLEQEDELEEEQQQEEEGKDQSSYPVAHQSSTGRLTWAFVNFPSVSLTFDPETGGSGSADMFISLADLNLCLCMQGTPSLMELMASVVMLMD